MADEQSPSGTPGLPGGGSVAVFDREGKETGQLQLPEAIFGTPVNAAVLHQAVRRQQANERQGTHDTKTRVLVELFDQMGAGARTLLIIREHDLNLEKSTRNLVSVKTILVGNLNPSDVLIADTIVFTRTSLDDLEGWLGASPHATGSEG